MSSIKTRFFLTSSDKGRQRQKSHKSLCVHLTFRSGHTPSATLCRGGRARKIFVECKRLANHFTHVFHSVTSERSVKL